MTFILILRLQFCNNEVKWDIYIYIYKNLLCFFALRALAHWYTSWECASSWKCRGVVGKHWSTRNTDWGL